MSMTSEDADSTTQPQPINTDTDAAAEAPLPLSGGTIEEAPPGGEESERPIIIPG